MFRLDTGYVELILKSMSKKSFITVFLVILVAAGSLFIYRSTRPKKFNVVLVSIDTLRPDHLGCYGYGRDTSPAIDRLAREGARFETVISSTSWTLPAHMAMLTSLPDMVHGVVWDYIRLDENRVTLAEMFKRNGYVTGGVFTGPYLLPRFGFGQGFDDYIDATLYDKKLVKLDVLNASELGRTTPGAMDKTEKWLRERNSDKPFFLFLHLFDVHQDFDPPPPYDTMFGESYDGDISNKGMATNPVFKKMLPRKEVDHFVALYDGEIRFVDTEGVDRLIKILESIDVLDNTLIVITSDHGEEFYEHGFWGHHHNLYDETLKVPLVLWQPELVPQNKVIKGQVRIIDIMPTILDLVGLPQSDETLGVSLVPSFEGKMPDGGPPRWALAELFGINMNMEALRSEKFKIIRDNQKKKIEYLDLEADPAEINPITDSENNGFKKALKNLAVFHRAMETCRKSIPWSGDRSIQLDEETRQRLRSLGYVE